MFYWRLRQGLIRLRELLTTPPKLTHLNYNGYLEKLALKTAKPFLDKLHDRVPASHPGVWITILKTVIVECFQRSTKKTYTKIQPKPPYWPLSYLTLPGVRISARWLFEHLREVTKRTFGFSVYYMRGLLLLLFIDACLTDDEPLWEPIEWSLVQTWILFIFAFGWIAENLIVSRYGSYTGRDKRVWFAWYKSFWLIELWYVISYAAATTFVIVPFYFETSYAMSFVFSWWHWYSRVFFFKFVSVLTLTLLFAQLLQFGVRWLNWSKALALTLAINILLSYLLYTQFFITFFGYFTDPIWYQKTRPIDYIQLSHEPSRWGWGPARKDHFTYHNVRTVFWFKNDGPFVAAFLMSQMFFFICLFFLYIYWVALFRRIYATKEVPLTYTTYCVSALRQFLYFFLLLYGLVFLSYISCYWRFPIEFMWSIERASWLQNFGQILRDYPAFLVSAIW